MRRAKKLNTEKSRTWYKLNYTKNSIFGPNIHKNNTDERKLKRFTITVFEVAFLVDLCRGGWKIKAIFGLVKDCVDQFVEVRFKNN